MSRFEHGLIDRLQHEFPQRDVAWISDEIPVQNVRNPSGLLVSRVKQAERDDTHRKGSRPSSKPAGGGWGFYSPGGNFTDKGDHDRPLTAFIRGLVELRRTTDESPADIAARIRGTGHEDAFGVITPSLPQWETLTGFDRWAGAFTSTSAGETVKRAGWADGVWCDQCSRIRKRDQVCRCNAVTMDRKLQEAIDAF